VQQRTFMVALGVGSASEVIGYVGRLQLNNNPFSEAALGTQLVTLTVAPAFIAGGIYLTLKHIVIIYGAKFSRIAPKWYTWIFVLCDVASILIQTAGAATASTGSSFVSTANDIMIVGLVSQVVTLAVFGVMALDVFFRIRRYQGEFEASTISLRESGRFKGLLTGLVVAYTTVFIRCIYRIAEMSGGWGNPIMQNQLAFVLCDGCMCAVAVLALNFAHPGFLFKQSYATLKMKAIPPTDMLLEGSVEVFPIEGAYPGMMK